MDDRRGGVMSSARTGQTSFHSPLERPLRLFAREMGIVATLPQFFPVATGATALSRVVGASARSFFGALRKGSRSGFVT